MEMADYHGCCDGQQCWLSESIMVSNGEVTIDIAPALVDKNDKYASRDRRVSALFSQQLFTLQFGIKERRLKM
jgi:hypothetical protein